MLARLRLRALLAAWRKNINSQPIPDLVTLDEALAAIASGKR